MGEGWSWIQDQLCWIWSVPECVNRVVRMDTFTRKVFVMQIHNVLHKFWSKQNEYAHIDSYNRTRKVFVIQTCKAERVCTHRFVRFNMFYAERLNYIRSYKIWQQKNNPLRVSLTLQSNTVASPLTSRPSVSRLILLWLFWPWTQHLRYRLSRLCVASSRVSYLNIIHKKRSHGGIYSLQCWNLLFARSLRMRRKRPQLSTSTAGRSWAFLRVNGQANPNVWYDDTARQFLRHLLAFGVRRRRALWFAAGCNGHDIVGCTDPSREGLHTYSDAQTNHSTQRLIVQPPHLCFWNRLSGRTTHHKDCLLCASMSWHFTA